MKLAGCAWVRPASALGADYVLVKAGSFDTSAGTVRLDSFEMPAAPVANAEYAAYVKAAGHLPT